MSDINKNKIRYEEELIKFVERVEKDNIEDIDDLNKDYGIYDEWIAERIRTSLLCKIFRQNNIIINELKELNKPSEVINVVVSEDMPDNAEIEI